MYIETVKNRNSPPCILLRESYREAGRVRKRTVSNLTHWPPHLVAAMRAALQTGAGGTGVTPDFDIIRSRAHGHVAAALGTLRHLGLDHLLSSRPCRQRDLVLAMIVARILEPGSKLAAARGLNAATRSSTLGELLDLQAATADELYAAMDWLLKRQPRIEKALAKRHFAEGTLVLYDVSSTYFEGRKCNLAQRGYSRDGKGDKPQILFGLLCDAQGCPVAVEVFPGNVRDTKTFAAQVEKVRVRFGVERVVWVGDRGMITDERITDDLRPAQNIDWITALNAAQVRALVASESLQLTLFDEQDLAEISDAAYPGERLIACRNPLLTVERRQKREQLLAATEAELDKIVAATKREKWRLVGQEKIGLRVGRVLGRFKMAKHFRLTIADGCFEYERDTDKIAREAAVDGIYIIRTSVPADALSAPDTVRTYKSLAQVERAFRSIKTMDLKVRPIFHRLDDRVRAHVFLCMLAYYVEWHMRKALAPILFHDADPPTTDDAGRSPVAPKRRSLEAERKARTQQTADGQPVHSFPTLLRDLATITRNTLQPNMAQIPTLEKTTRPTELQQRALDLLGVRL
jgi:transposase